VTLRRAIRAVRRRLAELVSSRHTVHRPIKTQAPPPPSAFAAFGEGAWLVPPARVDGASRASIGPRTVILEHLDLTVADGAQVTIGAGVRFGRFVTIACAQSVSIGADVSSSDGVSITDSWGPVGGAAPGLPPPAPAPVIVEDGAYLGANSTIGPGVTVGRGAFVGEGAVVVDDVPSYSVVYGNPAAVVRRYDASSGWAGPRFG
jgi:acetyltransferase-like isoleucine patch superfamily enzyme